MKRNIALILAIVGIILAIVLVNQVMEPVPELPPAQAPAKNPYLHAVSATGIIEAVQDNLPIGSPVAGIVEDVFVQVWQEVEKNDPLFSMDSRELKAQLQLAESKVGVSKAKLTRLEDQLDRLLSVEDRRAVSLDDVRTKENDVLVAYSEFEQAVAEAKLTKTMLDRLVVRAPKDGAVIQKNVNPGEYLPLNTEDPAIILGEIQELQIRADIDEQNAAQVLAGSSAIAYPKNHPEQRIPLTFVRIEPYVVPKKSLTGLSDERVDTRVLQVIYTFSPPKDFTVYIGQQVDVFIDASQEES